MPTPKRDSRRQREHGDDPPERLRVDRSLAPSTRSQHPPGAQQVPAVEDPDREQVDQVEEEPDVGERVEQVVAGRCAVAEARERREPAGDRSCDRDERVAPRVERLVAQGDVRAEERHEDRQRRPQALAPGLDVVADLVHEDEQDEAHAERPAPDESVGGDRDEDAEELQRARELDEQGANDEHRREQPPPRGRAVERRPFELGRLRLELACLPQLVRGVLHDPCPIHSSPPT